MVEVQRRATWQDIKRGAEENSVEIGDVTPGTIIRQSQVSEEDPSLTGEDLNWHNLQRLKQRQGGDYFQVVLVDGKFSLIPLPQGQLAKMVPEGKVLSLMFSISKHPQNGVQEVFDAFKIVDKPVPPSTS